jgi:Arc/MetJ family transcription regulator
MRHEGKAIHQRMCTVSCMRTNIEIDDEVMREAQRLTGVRTKREMVDLALRELVARHRRLGILELRGRVHWEGDLNTSRRGRT